MDSNRSSMNEGATFLTECVSDDMTACEAANATHECWTVAQAALEPVIGREGLGVLFRNGEEVAARNVQAHAPALARVSIEAFCDWVKCLESRQALVACKAFFLSVERYLVSLVGAAGLRRILRRGRAHRQAMDC